MESWVNISNRGTATIPRELWTRMGCPDGLFVSVDSSSGRICLSKVDDDESEPRSLFSSEGNRSPQVSLAGMMRKMGIERVMAGHRRVMYGGDALIIEVCNFWRA